MTYLGGKPMLYIYVAERPDGFHKIGVTGDVAARCVTLNAIHGRKMPVHIVRSFKIGHHAPVIEKVAHEWMICRGHSMHKLEWFNASPRACLAAVRKAVTLIDKIGVAEWRRRRVRARKAFMHGLTARRAWELWGPSGRLGKVKKKRKK